VGRQGVGREPVALQLVERTRQRVGVVGEEGRVLGGGQGQLGVEEHARGDARVEAQGVRGYEVARPRVEARHRRVQVRQEGRVEGRTHRDVRPGPVRGPVVAARAEAPGAAALRARGLAAVAPVAQGAPLLPVT
jgi:hypothetical protein